ncbi:hypothetical protein [Roseimaritima ulvae]|uniref:Uncharacterized protein n=1 Tax=Roseimaritima ulvae TaxID=980254 RepID=A0A5B9QWX3_9BACT|nr:hypothetical protein [Roseimaritima ulvae]QEG41616.1 hypothetical protein UC8_36420 [Roseimaritima ulvae]
MRRLFSVFVLCGAASGVLPSSATAQDTSLSKALEPLNRFGRAIGVGWGDGYHACDREHRLPTADLPPRSYAAQHALHPRYGQSHRQHWQAAAAANTPPAAYAYPTQQRLQQPAGSVPQFPVPPSVLQEIRSLQNDPQQAPPRTDSPRIDSPRIDSPRDETPQVEQLAPPAPTPPTSPRPADVLPRTPAASQPGEPMQQEISNQLDAMLDSLRDDQSTMPSTSAAGQAPASNTAPLTAPAPQPEQAAEDAAAEAPERALSEDERALPEVEPALPEDSILDGPLDEAPDQLLDAGDALLPAGDIDTDELLLDEADDALLDESDDLLLDDSDDLLLDEQTRASRFVREPVAGGPRRIPASQRIANQRAQRLAQQRAQQHAQQQLAAQREAAQRAAVSR